MRLPSLILATFLLFGFQSFSQVVEECFSEYVVSSWIDRVDICVDGVGLGSMRMVLDTGREYIYYEVDLSTYWEFVEASSPGEFFNYNIRNRYDYARLK